MTHTDKNGKETAISDLETSHLKNIIKRHNQLAAKGLVLRHGVEACSVGVCQDDYYYEEDVLFGKDVLDELNTICYIAEYVTRL